MSVTAEHAIAFIGMTQRLIPESTQSQRTQMKFAPSYLVVFSEERDGLSDIWGSHLLQIGQHLVGVVKPFKNFAQTKFLSESDSRTRPVPL